MNPKKLAWMQTHCYTLIRNQCCSTHCKSRMRSQENSCYYYGGEVGMALVWQITHDLPNSPNTFPLPNFLTISYTVTKTPHYRIGLCNHKCLYSSLRGPLKSQLPHPKTLPKEQYS